MPRVARRIFPGIPYHLVQRGNRKETVFFRDADRIAYLEWMGEYCRLHRAQVLAYCLMTNHVHVVVVPASEDSLENAFRALHTRYAHRINRIKGWKGHVWQGRPFAAALDDAYLWAAVRYVELNPVRAGMVQRAEEHPWSSAAAHCGLREDPLVSGAEKWLSDLPGGARWTEWLAEGDRPQQLEVLRANITKGFPCGDEKFVAEMERRVGQPLRPRRRGRPRQDIGVRPQFVDQSVTDPPQAR